VLIAEALVLHYNNRMKNGRNDTLVTEKYLAKNTIDVAAITGKKSEKVNWLYDWQELVLFKLILVGSAVPTFLIYWFR
jgi:hypothetical protein